MIYNQMQQEYDNFCHNITWLRKHHHLSKKEMAKLLGISIGSLNKIESGQIPPRMTTEVLTQANKHFGIPIHNLFGSRLGK